MHSAEAYTAMHSCTLVTLAVKMGLKQTLVSTKISEQHRFSKDSEVAKLFRELVMSSIVFVSVCLCVFCSLDLPSFLVLVPAMDDRPKYHVALVLRGPSLTQDTWA